MTFEAKYGGRCGVCNERIAPGDVCTYAEDVVVHEDCEAAIRSVSKPPRPVCDKCFIETSANGKCGCDE
jgi:hypothetical protein